MESVTVQQVPTTAGWNRDQTSARFFSLLIYARNPVFVAHVPGYLTVVLVLTPISCPSTTQMDTPMYFCCVFETPRRHGWLHTYNVFAIQV